MGVGVGAATASEGPDGDEPPHATMVAHNAASPRVDGRGMASSPWLFRWSGRSDILCGVPAHREALLIGKA